LMFWKISMDPAACGVIHAKITQAASVQYVQPQT